MLAAGGVSATGFAPLGWWPVTLVALALLIDAIACAPRRRGGVMAAYAFGVGQFTVGLNWIATAFTYQAAMPAWLGAVAVVVLALYLAIFPAMAAAIGRMIAPGGARLVLALAGGWTVCEWLRSWLFTGFPWNPLAAVALPVAWPARLIGSYGLSGLVMLAAGALWLLARQRWRAGLVLGLPILALGIASGMALGDEADPATGPAFVLVQPDFGQGGRASAADDAGNVAALARIGAGGTMAPHLLLWPEGVVPDYLYPGYASYLYQDTTGHAPDAARHALATLLGPGDLLATGTERLVTRGDRVVAARNSVAVIDGRGRIVGTYDKAHLVPYGEYLPMRGLLAPLGLARLVPGDIDFWPGPGPRTLNLGPLGRMGVQICYEIVFSGHVVDRAHRPDYIFNPTNDAWFGAWGPPQHLAQAQLRAIEEGLPVLRATTNGISALIAPNGRLVAMIARHVAGRISGRVPHALAPPPFARLGSIATLAFALALLLCAIAMRRRAG